MLRFLSSLLVGPYRRKKPPSKTVAIVVPLSLRPELTPDEQVSMQHLLHFFGAYDKYLIAPRGLAVPYRGFGIKRFSRKYFGCGTAHNRLTYARSFYRAFQDYEFIFFYHLDSLAFSDQLPQWCKTDLDYIGAPWLPCADTPWVEKARVGNGGFTLLRVEAALKVLHNRYRKEPMQLWIDLVDRNARLVKPFVNFLRKLPIPQFGAVDRARARWDQIEHPTEHGLNNDLFWADQAIRYLPAFKVATVEEGLRFAFEAAPRICFEMNHYQLPFGCHAWSKFDRGFWEPHLLRADERVGHPRPQAT
ncbi:MAG: hypothetical protein QOG67_3111 [Verrucomicrobiota bacterium]|jgi:hypothetical protein